MGSAAGLIYSGCHGDDEILVFDELCQVVQEAIELFRKKATTAAAYFGSRLCKNVKAGHVKVKIDSFIGFANHTG